MSIALVALVSTGLLVVLLRRDSGEDLKVLGERLKTLETVHERSERGVRDEVARNREELSESARRAREESSQSMKGFTDSVLKRMGELSTAQKGQLDGFSQQLSRLTSSNEQTMERMRITVEGRLKDIQADNSKKLEEMRRTVDEKLQGTLEKRLGESFRLVSERLEQVHKGLGEMQHLATGVGDLKRVLTNVKVRGTWGEIQLVTLVEQILSPEQYETNVATKPGSDERVEVCIKLPGRTGNEDDVVWLPIDAKFPQEDYQRLLEAQDNADADGQAAARKQIALRIKAAAKAIRDKYINPPRTTDVAVLFLPTEGLFAEVLRQTALTESLQREFRIMLAGPTTLGALLNSLQMGFRTLAIEQRSGEVWTLLASVKNEFGKFGAIIAKVQKKLQEASNVIDTAASKSRTIERTLRKVEELPTASTADQSLARIVEFDGDPDDARADTAVDGLDEVDDDEAAGEQAESEARTETAR